MGFSPYSNMDMSLEIKQNSLYSGECGRIKPDDNNTVRRRHTTTQYFCQDRYIFITIEKQDEPIIPPDNVLAVDLGCKNIAVNTVNTKPNFYGDTLRGIRGFYFNLRRKLGEKKASDKIKSLKNIEFLQANHELHKISKAIVEEAKRTNAVIVLGKLKGIRKNIKGSRRMRRLINVSED
jgi:putative transposase